MNICAWANSNLSIQFKIYWQIFTWKKSVPSIFSTSWHGVKLKLTLGIPLGIWSWLVSSTSWSRGIVWKRFWYVIYVLYTRPNWWYHISSPFVEGYHWSQFSFIPYVKIKIPGGRADTVLPLSTNHICKKSSRYEWSNKWEVSFTKLKTF